MLEHIYIQNLGLVDTLHIDFHKEITMFTGETGAGKSMLLSALLLLMGGKVDESTVRLGKEQAIITSIWNIENKKEVQAWLGDRGFECNEFELHIKRVVKSSKRSQCFIQGQNVTVGELSDCVSLLCEIHTQHENQSLFKTALQLKMVDKYAEIEERVADFVERLQKHKEQEKLYLQYINNEQQRERERDYLQYAIEEIQNAKILPGEDEKIALELQTTSNIEQITKYWNTILELLEEQEGVRGKLQDTAKLLDTLNSFQNNLDSINSRFESVMIEFEDILLELNKEHRKLEYVSPELVVDLENRLLELETLKKKYGPKLEDVDTFLKESQKKITYFEEYDFNAESTFAKLEKEKSELTIEAQNISDIRKEKSLEFANSVNEILSKLGMANSKFSVNFESQDLGKTGIDKIEFFISTSKGSAMLPLMRIASGGELSRIMLAIKIVSTKTSDSPSLILDEIDAGIGGNTARVLAEYIHHVGKKLQIICVTHLPIMAACSKMHYLVQKIEESDSAVISIDLLDQDTRVGELARMISGNPEDTIAQKQALQFLRLYT